MHTSWSLLLTRPWILFHLHLGSCVCVCVCCWCLSFVILLFDCKAILNGVPLLWLLLTRSVSDEFPFDIMAFVNIICEWWIPSSLLFIGIVCEWWMPSSCPMDIVCEEWIYASLLYCTTPFRCIFDNLRSYFVLARISCGNSSNMRQLVMVLLHMNTYV